MRENVIKIVDHQLSDDTIKCAEQIMEMAKSGKLKGIAFVGVMSGRRYFGGTAGEARRDPTFTRGMLRGLDDKLARVVHGTGTSS